MRICPRHGIYRKCLPLLSNLSKQGQKPHISKLAPNSLFFLDLVFIFPVIDRLENSSGRHVMCFLKWLLSGDCASPSLGTARVESLKVSQRCASGTLYDLLLTHLIIKRFFFQSSISGFKGLHQTINSPPPKPP